MKRKISFSIKANIFLSISILTIVLIACLWVMQLVFLNSLYKATKEKDVQRASRLIAESLENSSSDDFVSQVSAEYQLCVNIYDCYNGYSLYERSDCQKSDCFLHTLTHDISLFSTWLTNAAGNNGVHTETIKKEDFDNYNLYGFEGEAQNTFISVEVATTSETTYLIVVASNIEPERSTVSAFRLMLGIISLVLAAMAIIISLVLSKRISAPIAHMNNKAKRLAHADYDVEFVPNGPTELRELASTLNYTATELGKLDSMQKELIANISHDLRTPLTMISGYAEMMRDIPSENTPENLQIIIDETSRLTSLVNDMLSVSRLQAGTQKMDIRRVNLTNAVFQTVERYARFKEHNDFVINFEYDDTVYVMADEIRLLQVIYNLINNAINYTGVDRTVVVKQTVDNGIVRISVCDTGDGIKEEDLPLIWDRYYKVDKIHRRAVVGTGLGLSIVKNILLAHGARFGVSSELKVGSVFWFEFKIVE